MMQLRLMLKHDKGIYYTYYSYYKDYVDYMYYAYCFLNNFLKAKRITDGRQVVLLSVSLACHHKFSYYTFGVTFYVFKNCFNIKCTLIHRLA